jgi:midasin
VFVIAADFLGGLRPVRGKEQIRAQLLAKFKVFFEHALQMREALDEELVGHVESVLLGLGAFTINDVTVLLERVWQSMKQYAASAVTNETALALPHAEVEEIDSLHKKYKALFAWYDGPLVQAMKRGDLFLIDEISLAEDSVLERLNRYIPLC